MCEGLPIDASSAPLDAGTAADASPRLPALWDSLPLLNGITAHKRWQRPLAWVSGVSFGLYLLHPIYLRQASLILESVGIYRSNWLRYVLALPFTYVCTLIAIWLIHYVPGSRFVVGAKRSAKNTAKKG